jgi:integrase
VGSNNKKVYKKIMLDQQRNEITNVISRKSEEEKEQEQHQQTSFASINHGALYDNLNDVDNYWSLYIYAMKSPVTREKYVKRLNKFFDFIGIEGLSVKEKSAAFLQIARQNPQLAFNNIIKFLQFQNQRVNAKEITGATVRNYVKSIKLFCEMADLPIAWKKITRGLPRGRKYADDRIPTIQELRRLIAYPDRRIKAIVYTMASSGIRLGSWDYLRWGHVRPVEKRWKASSSKIDCLCRRGR